MIRHWVSLPWTEEKARVLGLDLKQIWLDDCKVNIPYPGIGVDPGRNFGFALALPPHGPILIYHGYLHAAEEHDYAMDGWTALKLVEELVSTAPHGMDAAVEGAAHSDNVGQANLAYIREGFYLGLLASGHFPKMTAINTARKSSTGNGRVSMAQLIPNMNSNAADALGLALHAGGYRAEAMPTP